MTDDPTPIDEMPELPEGLPSSPAEMEAAAVRLVLEQLNFALKGFQEGATRKVDEFRRAMGVPWTSMPAAVNEMMASGSQWVLQADPEASRNGIAKWLFRIDPPDEQWLRAAQPSDDDPR